MQLKQGNLWSKQQFSCRVVYNCKRKGKNSVAACFFYWLSLHIRHPSPMSINPVSLTHILHLSGNQERLSREKSSPDRRCSQVCRPDWCRVVWSQCKGKYQCRRGEGHTTTCHENLCMSRVWSFSNTCTWKLFFNSPLTSTSHPLFPFFFLPPLFFPFSFYPVTSCLITFFCSYSCFFFPFPTSLPPSLPPSLHPFLAILCNHTAYPANKEREHQRVRDKGW